MARHDDQIIIFRVSAIKRLALKFLTNPVVLRGVEQSTRGAASILTLHRFAAYGRPGHDPKVLAGNLEWLRQRGYRLTSLLDLIEAIRQDRPPSPRTVVFTVDDGYADFVEVAAPVFARYDCPVTVFLITGFLDGGRWMWWDRVRFAMENTGRSQLEIAFGEHLVRYQWDETTGRVRTARDLIHRLKLQDTETRERTQSEIETRLEVTLPEQPPQELAPMSWHQVRSLGNDQVMFGPHSVTHPILSRSGDAQCRREIFDSWDRLKHEVANPVPVFCWPNGDAGSFGPREARLVAEAGMIAALSTVQSSITRRSWTHNGGPFALPRYAYPQSAVDFAQVVSGLERLKAIARREARS